MTERTFSFLTTFLTSLKVLSRVLTPHRTQCIPRPTPRFTYRCIYGTFFAMVFCFLSSFGRCGPHPLLMKEKVPRRLSIVWIRTQCFFFHWQMAYPCAVKDKFIRKTQDLNPERKEGNISIMLLGVLLGAYSFWIRDQGIRWAQGALS